MNNKKNEKEPLEGLPAYQKRKFLPENANLISEKAIKEQYQRLIDEEIDSSEDLEQWVLNRSELEAALDEVGSILYIRMTCQTDKENYAKAYQDFIEKISPVVKLLENRLNKKFLEAIDHFPLDDGRYGIYIRAIKTDDALFVEANIELEKDVELLSQEYQAICGKQTVEFKGKEYTMPQMAAFALEPDREVREEAWKSVNERRLQDKDQLDDLFDKMLKTRNQIAHNAGFKNYIEYKFKSLHRFDYSPGDCKQYHATVESVVVPVWKEILKKRKEQMELDALRPWDTAVDPLGRKPLKPFDKVDVLIEGCRKIFHALDDALGKQFEEMIIFDMLDLESRKGKAPGGYQSCLNETRKPFIFMNAVGLDQDVRTLLHEGGHAFHSFACRDMDLIDYRHGPMEFNEVASMAMELLGGEHLSVFYDEDEKFRSVEDHFEGIVYVLVWVATIDCFQHWIYENPDHTKVDRKEAWLRIRRRFSGDMVDWQGLEEVECYLWHRQLHIFEVPFYYIEYAIAQLGALQLWMNSKKDFQKALTGYKNALSLGGSRRLPELFLAAGIRFDFSENVISPLMQELKKRLKLAQL